MWNDYRKDMSSEIWVATQNNQVEYIIGEIPIVEARSTDQTVMI